MAGNVNQVIVNGETIIDLTTDTVSPKKMPSGVTAHDASGAPIKGSVSTGWSALSAGIRASGETSVLTYAKVIFIILLQQLDNRITYPLVVGRSIGLPSVWVFAAVIIGGGISGILGMMFTVPLFAALYKLLSADARNRITIQKNE